MESMGPSFRGSATSADFSFRGPSTRVGPSACPGLWWHTGRRLFRDGAGVACLIGHVTLSPSFSISVFALLCTFVHFFFCLLMMLKVVQACCCGCVLLVCFPCVCFCVCTCLCFALFCPWSRLSPSVVRLFPVFIPRTNVFFCAHSQACCLNVEFALALAATCWYASVLCRLGAWCQCHFGVSRCDKP